MCSSRLACNPYTVQHPSKHDRVSIYFALCQLVQFCERESLEVETGEFDINHVSGSLIYVFGILHTELVE